MMEDITAEGHLDLGSQGDGGGEEEEDKPEQIIRSG